MSDHTAVFIHKKRCTCITMVTTSVSAMRWHIAQLLYELWLSAANIYKVFIKLTQAQTVLYTSIRRIRPPENEESTALRHQHTS